MKLQTCLLLTPILFLSCSKSVNSISFEKSEYTFYGKDHFTLFVKCTPSDYEINPKLTWEVSDPSIANIVYSSGLLSAIFQAYKYGSLTISVTDKSHSNKLNANCIVHIVPKLVEEIHLSTYSMTLEQDKQQSISVEFIPSDVEDTRIKWSSDNTSIATVDEKGVVTAINVGQCSIKASASSNMEISSTCSITVIPIAVNDIKIDSTSSTILLGDEGNLSYIITPQNAANQKVMFTSSNDNIISIDSLGHYTAHKLGDATLSVITEDGNHKASINIKVVTIESFIQASFSTPGSVVINGYVRGTAMMTVTNNSTKSITIKSCMMYDANNTPIYSNTTPFSLLPTEQHSFQQSCYNTYWPWGICRYDYLGVEYNVKAAYSINF